MMLSKVNRYCLHLIHRRFVLEHAPETWQVSSVLHWLKLSSATLCNSCQFTGCSMVKLTIASWRHIVQDQMQSMADKCCSHSMNEPPRSAQGQERRIQLNYQKIMTGPPDRTHRLIEIHCLTVRDQTTFLWSHGHTELTSQTSRHCGQLTILAEGLSFHWAVVPRIRSDRQFVQWFISFILEPLGSSRLIQFLSEIWLSDPKNRLQATKVIESWTHGLTNLNIMSKVRSTLDTSWRFTSSSTTLASHRILRTCLPSRICSLSVCCSHHLTVISLIIPWNEIVFIFRHLSGIRELASVSLRTSRQNSQINWDSLSDSSWSNNLPLVLFVSSGFVWENDETVNAWSG